MKTFLEEIVEDIKVHYPNGLEDVCVVFPNRRSSLFFLKYLKESADKPVWAPNVTTINELFEGLSDYQSVDKLSVLFDLFDIYKANYNEEETFDSFYYWGSMLLRDFDELDKYEVDAKYLYQNLHHHKEIDDQFNAITKEQELLIKSFWKNFEGSTSTQKEQFESIWLTLYKIYGKLNKHLSSKGEAYDGMVYRNVSERIINDELELQYSKYIFVGFNALSKCEKRLFTSLKKAKKALFYWDVDRYYLDDLRQEAGLFLRWNVRNFPMPKTFKVKDFLSEQIKTKTKEIRIYAVNGEIGQTQLIGDLLEGDLNEVKDNEKVAVVLPDEHLLLPLLHAIPSSVDCVNVSMGYPVRETPLFALFGFLVALQQSKKEEDGVFYSSVEALNVIEHPYLMYQDASLVKGFVYGVKRRNQQWLSESELVEALPFLKVVFKSVSSVSEMFDYLLNILEQLHQSMQVDEGVSLEQEYVYHFYTQISRLKDLLVNREDLSMKIFLRLLNQFLQDLRVPFNGEPLQGLQVMGVLETRCLDFDHLYLMSMNEGNLPATSVDSSFIPYNLRKGFGLPTIEEYDAVYAYYFYRLIQRTRKVSLFYNSTTDGDMKAQTSRFVHQLRHELIDGSIAELVVANDLKVQKSEGFLIQKNDQILDRLSQFEVQEGGYCARPLSPTAIDTHLRCGLQFYYKYILGLKELDEVSNEIDAMQFGNLLHRSIELLYRPIVGRLVSESMLNQSKSSILKVVERACDEVFGEQNVSFNDGELRVVQNVLKQYITGIVDLDRHYAPFKIIGLEEEVEMCVEFEGRQVKFRGSIDRIDEKDGLVRVVDYKTGKTELKIPSIEGLFEQGGKGNNAYALQALMYSIMYLKKGGGVGKVVYPALLPVKQLHVLEGVQGFEVQQAFEGKDGGVKSYYRELDSVGEDVVGSYQSGLKDWLVQLYDKSQSFEQTEDRRTCDYCAYQSICRKDIS